MQGDRTRSVRASVRRVPVTARLSGYTRRPPRSTHRPPLPPRLTTVAPSPGRRVGCAARSSEMLPRSIDIPDISIRRESCPALKAAPGGILSPPRTLRRGSIPSRPGLPGQSALSGATPWSERSRPRGAVPMEPCQSPVGATCGKPNRMA